jgi:hypothetical protein
VQGKIDEAKAIAEKLNMAVTTGTTGSGKTVDQLDAKTVDQLIKDVVVFQTSEQYYKTFTYYEKCEWWQVFCGDEVYQGSWYEAETEKSLLKESTTVTKSAGTCYQLKETCGRILQPCDLSSGKFCTPIWKDECVESRVIVTCPQ